MGTAGPATPDPDGVDIAGLRPSGPHDVDDLPDDGVPRADLGSMLISPAEGLELRLQVDDASGQVSAVILAGPDGALELRAFSASRGSDLWTESRGSMAAEIAQRGGTADVREGPWGPELHCQMPVTMPDGQPGVQPSRVIGINGPRWFLRANLLGIPALDADKATLYEQTLATMAVRRGSGAMPPGEALPVELPDNARRVDPSPN